MELVKEGPLKWWSQRGGGFGSPVGVDGADLELRPATVLNFCQATGTRMTTTKQSRTEPTEKKKEAETGNGVQMKMGSETRQKGRREPEGAVKGLGLLTKQMELGGPRVEGVQENSRSEETLQGRWENVR